MNNIHNFEYNDKKVRVLDLNGKIWFVGIDAAKLLGYKNESKAIVDHVPGKHKKLLTSQNSNLEGLPNRGLMAISEPGFFRLVIRSDLPEADNIVEWITSEVMPSIRKTGQYTLPNNNMLSNDAFSKILQMPSTKTQLKRNKILENKGWSDHDIKFRQLSARANTIYREALGKYKLKKNQYIELQRMINKAVFGMDAVDLKRAAGVPITADTRNVLPENTMLLNLLFIEIQLTNTFEKYDKLTYNQIKYKVVKICEALELIEDSPMILQLNNQTQSSLDKFLKPANMISC